MEFLFRLTFMGLDLEAVCFPSRVLRVEADMYKEIAQWCAPKGTHYTRVDTNRQQGFPDILLLNGNKYALVECKLGKTAKLNLEALHWQPGQIAVAVGHWRKGRSYFLAVGYDSSITFIGAPLDTTNNPAIAGFF